MLRTIAGFMLALLLPVQAQATALVLDRYQDSSGLIRTFANGDVADAYFGLYALDLARRHGLDVSAPAQAFIRWGLSVQNPDGRFDGYCRSGGMWRTCRRSDSDDATLARWILLLHEQARGRKPPDSWRASIERSRLTLEALRLPSGVYSVFPSGTPGYEGYALFKDNVEVLSCFERLADLAIVAKDRQRWRTQAVQLRAAMAVVFGSDYRSMKRLALPTDYKERTFYPHAVATPFGWLEGYFAAPAPKEWIAWLSDNHENWSRNARNDYPWGVIAIEAVHAGDRVTASCWLSAYQRRRATLKGWNVLEEVTTQILESMGLKPCPESNPFDE